MSDVISDGVSGRSRECFTVQARTYANLQPLSLSPTKHRSLVVDFSFNQLRQPANHHHGHLRRVIDLEKMIG